MINARIDCSLLTIMIRSLTSSAGLWTAAVLLVVAAPCRAASFSTAVDSQPQPTTASSSTTGTWIDQSVPIDCSYDVVVAEGGQFYSLGFETFAFGNPYRYPNDCVLKNDPEFLLGASFGEVARDRYLLENLDGTFAPGTAFARCHVRSSIDPRSQPRELRFTDIQVYGVSAQARDGLAAVPPHLCATNLACESDAVKFGWRGAPLCGDSDYDGDRDATDALAALRTAVGLPSCRPLASTCDTDASGRVGATDAARILKVAVGQDVALSRPLPCYPGTIGTPSPLRIFRVDFGLSVVTSEDVRIQAAWDQSKIYDADCWNVADHAEFKAKTNQTLVILSRGAFLTDDELVSCNFKGIGDAFPDRSSFQVSAKVASGEVLDPNSVTIAIRSWAFE